MQRTEVMPRDRSLAEKEPAKFAALLAERLQKVKHDRDSVEKVMQSINETTVCHAAESYSCRQWLVKPNLHEYVWLVWKFKQSVYGLLFLSSVFLCFLPNMSLQYVKWQEEHLTCINLCQLSLEAEITVLF